MNSDAYHPETLHVRIDTTVMDDATVLRHVQNLSKAEAELNDLRQDDVPQARNGISGYGEIHDLQLLPAIGGGVYRIPSISDTLRWILPRNKIKTNERMQLTKDRGSSSSKCRWKQKIMWVEHGSNMFNHKTPGIDSANEGH